MTSNKEHADILTTGIFISNKYTSTNHNVYLSASAISFVGRIACNAERCISHGNSVRLSVCLSVCHTLVPYPTNEGRITLSSLWGSKIILVIWYQQWFWATSPSNLWPTPLWKTPISPMSAYNVSTLRASEKSSIIENRKLTTRFPRSYRWCAYVTPNSPKGWLKKRICRFCE